MPFHNNCGGVGGDQCEETEDLASGPLGVTYWDSWEPCEQHLAFLD